MNPAYHLPAAGPQPLPADVRAMNAAAAALLLLAVLLLLGMGVAALLRLPAFTLRVVSVQGDVTRNSAATLRANAVSQLSGNFFSVNLAHAKTVFESVPWVRSAVVQRVWPNRLAVTLQEHRAVAYWEQIGAESRPAAPRRGQPRDELTTHLVNTAGEVFDANLGDVEDENLPTLQGPEGGSAAMLDMFGRLRDVFEAGDRRIDTLRLSERGSWAVTLEDGAQIELGRGEPDEVLARTQRFLGTLAQITHQYQQAPLESADLRYPQGYAVHLKGMATVPAAPASKQTH